jgi:hypothetical protein
MPVPIPLVMGGMIIASERIRPAWREPVRRPLPVPDRSRVLGQGGAPGARTEPATLTGGAPVARPWIRSQLPPAGTVARPAHRKRSRGDPAESARLCLERAEKARGHNSLKPGMPSSFCLGYHLARWNVGDPTRRLKTCPWSRARPERGLKGIIIRRASDLTTTSIREHDPADDRR